jgi:hypothetical protein
MLMNLETRLYQVFDDLDDKQVEDIMEKFDAFYQAMIVAGAGDILEEMLS